MEIQIAVDPNHEFQRKLDEAGKVLGDLTIPLTLISNEWYKGNRSIFELKGPGRYKDLSPKYKIQKAKKYGDDKVYPILKATGKLAESITNPNDSNAIRQIVNKVGLVLGTKVKYGVFHQSLRPRTKIPYRPFLLVGVEQIAPNDIKQNRVKNWIKILESYMNQKLSKI